MQRKQRKILAVILALALLLPLVGGATHAIAQEVPDMQDVSPGDWFYRYVTRSFHFGLTTGTSGTGFRFEPHRNVTRAEFVTMLGRLHEYSGETINQPGASPFYYYYLNWAVELGIVQGDGHGNLMPHALLTREQMAVIVYRYIHAFEEIREIFENTWHFPWRFPDMNEVSPWAFHAVSGFRRYELCQGIEGGHFRPRDSSTRADALSILVRVGIRVHDWRWWEEYPWNQHPF